MKQHKASLIFFNGQASDSVVQKCQERAMQYDISTMAKRYNEVYEGLMG